MRSPSATKGRGRTTHRKTHRHRATMIALVMVDLAFVGEADGRLGMMPWSR